jgi:hypothetical protein
VLDGAVIVWQGDFPRFPEELATSRFSAAAEAALAAEIARLLPSSYRTLRAGNPFPIGHDREASLSNFMDRNESSEEESREQHPWDDTGGEEAMLPFDEDDDDVWGSSSAPPFEEEDQEEDQAVQHLSRAAGTERGFEARDVFQLDEADLAPFLSNALRQQG